MGWREEYDCPKCGVTHSERTASRYFIGCDFCPTEITGRTIPDEWKFFRIEPGPGHNAGQYQFICCDTCWKRLEGLNAA